MADSDCELTSYAEMIEVVQNLHMLVRERRRARRLSMRAAAGEMAIPVSVLHRMHNGSGVSLENLVMILNWLDRAEALCPSSPSTSPCPPTTCSDEESPRAGFPAPDTVITGSWLVTPPT